MLTVSALALCKVSTIGTSTIMTTSSSSSSAAVSRAPGPLASFPCVDKTKFARRLSFACFLFSQNTEHVHSDAAISRGVDKPDLLVPSLQGLGKLKRLLSRVSLDDFKTSGLFRMPKPIV